MRLSALRGRALDLWLRAFRDTRIFLGLSASDAGQAEAMRQAVERSKSLIGELDTECRADTRAFVPG